MPDPESLPDTYNIALVFIYSLVLVIGFIGLGLMIHILKYNMRSVITIAMLNLSLAHLLFLLTVPFRIYYYYTNNWGLGHPLCRAISAMIHVHMYLVFVFYIVILIIRLLGFHSKKDSYEFYRKLHAFGASLAMWVLVCVVLVPIFFIKYGTYEHFQLTNQTNNTQCFNFGKNLNEDYKAKALNYFMSCLIIVMTCVLITLQCHVMVILVRKYGRDCTSHQEFLAQLKSLGFASVLLVCFVPYHVFRIYYVSHLSNLEHANELFLSLTALSCCDMLTFLGRRHCTLCDRICNG